MQRIELLIWEMLFTELCSEPVLWQVLCNKWQWISMNDVNRVKLPRVVSNADRMTLIEISRVTLKRCMTLRLISNRRYQICLFIQTTFFKSCVSFILFCCLLFVYWFEVFGNTSITFNIEYVYVEGVADWDKKKFGMKFSTVIN